MGGEKRKFSLNLRGVRRESENDGRLSQVQSGFSIVLLTAGQLEAQIGRLPYPSKFATEVHGCSGGGPEFNFQANHFFTAFAYGKFIFGRLLNS